jgi:hypothetical protein
MSLMLASRVLLLPPRAACWLRSCAVRARPPPRPPPPPNRPRARLILDGCRSATTAYALPAPALLVRRPPLGCRARPCGVTARLLGARRKEADLAALTNLPNADGGTGGV